MNSCDSRQPWKAGCGRFSSDCLSFWSVPGCRVGTSVMIQFAWANASPIASLTTARTFVRRAVNVTILQSVRSSVTSMSILLWNVQFVTCFARSPKEIVRAVQGSVPKWNALGESVQNPWAAKCRIVNYSVQKLPVSPSPRGGDSLCSGFSKSGQVPVGAF